MWNYGLRFLLVPALLAAACARRVPAPPAEETASANVPAPADLQPLRSKVERLVRDGKAPSFAVGVARDGKVIWQEALGWADREKKVPATSDTIYPVASVSKSMTATGLFLLADRGLVKIGSPVQDYLGPARLRTFRPREAAPTVADVLNMTGGIPHYWQYTPKGEATQPLDTADILRRHGIVAFPPGKFFHYSNLSYAVVEQVIARVSGSGFADFMRREVFLPLGMKRTAVHVSADQQRHAAVPYDRANRPAQPYDFYPKGGAGFHSTAADLLRFATFHLNQPLPGQQPLLPAATVDAMHRVADPGGPSKRYANGWGVLDLGRDGPTLVSNGQILGAAAAIVLLPQHRIAIVCLTNISSSPRLPDTMAFAIADALVPGFAKKWKELEAAVEQEEEAKKPLTSLVGKWAGELIAGEEVVPVTISVQPGGKISVGVKGSNDVPLKEAHFTGVAVKGEFAGTVPTKEAKAQAHNIEIELYKNGDALQGVARAVTAGEKPGFGLPFYLTLRKK
jgi:CubicO group peptidase (beta-lactamase class C family)